MNTFVTYVIASLGIFTWWMMHVDKVNTKTTIQTAVVCTSLCTDERQLYLMLTLIDMFVETKMITCFQSHICSSSYQCTAVCVMSSYTEESWLNPRPLLLQLVDMIWSGQGLSRGWSHTCGRPLHYLQTCRIFWVGEGIGYGILYRVWHYRTDSGLSRPLCLILWKVW